MINKISILYFQLLIVILETASNLQQPEYSIKILNTEHTIISLGDVDDDDLEIIRGSTDNNQMQERLNKLHKFVNFIEMTERPREKLYLAKYNKRKQIPLFEISYPYLPHAIAANEKHLGELERRNKFARMKKKKKKRKRKELLRRGEFKIQQGMKIIPKSSLDLEEDADYRNLEKEYLDDIAQNMNDNTAFKYSDEGKPEETIQDVIHKILDIKTPQDCQNFSGLGIQAIECSWKNFKTGEIDRDQLLYSIGFILIIWFSLYLLIAVPLWCAKGWCCCCCRCSFCFPNKTVADIKEYIQVNPPGIYTNAKGVKTEYVPTMREIELYERLRRLIANF